MEADTNGQKLSAEGSDTIMPPSSTATTEFPGNKVLVYKNCLAEETLTAVRNAAELYAQAPNYWLPREVMDNSSHDKLLTPAEVAIVELYHSVTKSKLPEHCTGAEWWVQVYKGGSGLAFHFDKDEYMYKTNRVTRHPLFSSVLYLSGTDEDRLRQACTVILDQRLDSMKGVTDPESPTSCVFIPPTSGKYCLFDGCLGHGVLDSSNPEWRATLLVNWWIEKPMAVQRPTADELEKLSAQAPAMNVQLLSKSAPSPNSLPQAKMLQYPVIRVPEEDEDVQESGILVDDLMDSYLLDAFGANAIQAVAVWNGTHVLYPIDPTKTKQDISKKLIIPAAFIPEDVSIRNS